MKKEWYSKLIVALVIGLNVWFANKVFDTVSSGAIVSDAFIYAWFGFTGAELLAMAGIKVRKMKIKKTDENNY